jgi:hypothetical protein
MEGAFPGADAAGCNRCGQRAPSAGAACVSFAKPSPNGVDVLYSDEYVAQRMQTNPYVYANNNPLKYVDPSGLAARCETLADTPKACNATGGMAKVLVGAAATKIEGNIDISGSFREAGDCQCKCCKMELWVRGSYAVILPDGRRVPIPPHRLPGSGKPLDPKLFQQDSPTLSPTPCKVTATDHPGLNMPKGTWDRLSTIPGIQVDLQYDFELHAIDVCDPGKPRIATYDFSWSLRGPLTAPNIVTDLAKC